MDSRSFVAKFGNLAVRNDAKGSTTLSFATSAGIKLASGVDRVANVPDWVAILIGLHIASAVQHGILLVDHGARMLMDVMTGRGACFFVQANRPGALYIFGGAKRADALRAMFGTVDVERKGGAYVAAPIDASDEGLQAIYAALAGPAFAIDTSPREYLQNIACERTSPDVALEAMGDAPAPVATSPVEATASKPPKRSKVKQAAAV